MGRIDVLLSCDFTAELITGMVNKAVAIATLLHPVLFITASDEVNIATLTQPLMPGENVSVFFVATREKRRETWNAVAPTATPKVLMPSSD